MKVKILAGVGIGFLIASIFMAIRNGKAEARDEMESETLSDDAEEETILDTIKRKVKTYWPTMVLFGVAIFCLSFAVGISIKSTTASVAAYKLAVDTLDKRKAATEEIVGKNKESYISAKVGEYKMRETVLNRSVVKRIDENETLLYDPICKAYFYMDLKEVKELSKRLNDSLKCNGGDRKWLPYRELKNGLGLKDVKVTFDEDELGWNGSDSNVWIGFDVQVLDDGERCIVLTYRLEPKYNM